MAKDYECKYCDRKFGSKRAREKHSLAKHEDEMFLTPGQKKKALGWTLGIIVFALAVWGVLQVGQNYEPSDNQPVTQGPVHWHADLKIYTCGDFRDLSHLGQTGHAGTNLLHTHGDNVIHIEGQVPNEDFITLGSYFDAINRDFSNTTILDYENGDECPDGEPGEVKLSVNGQENSEFRDYVVRSDDNIRITFN